MSTEQSKYQFNELQEKWLQALESGEYRQGKGCLGTLEDGLCCLGVLCVVAGEDFDEGSFFAPKKVARAALFREWHGEAAKKFLVNNVLCDSLIGANDHASASFAEIAAAIRANPENFFLSPEGRS